MLKRVRTTVRFAIWLAVAAAVTAAASGSRGIRDTAKPRLSAKAPVPLRQSSSSPSTSSPTPAQATGRILQTVVLDPAHGGTDEGAHSSGGILEKDVVLTLAQDIQARLQKDGLTVVLTRSGDQTLSFEQRAAVANAQPNAIFVTLHVGSSGALGSANAYYYDFSQVIENQPESPVKGLLEWNRAQFSSEALSQRLAQLVQVELSERLRGSPELPSSAPVYQLRVIAEPAIAIEIGNINAPNVAALDAFGKPLAESISRAIQAFRVVYQTEAP